MIILFLLSVSMNLMAAPVSWTATNYEKVILPTKVPEGIEFQKYSSPNGSHVYKLGYFMGDKLITSRMLPEDLYRELNQKLKSTVFDLAQKNKSILCTDQVGWATGIKGKSRFELTTYCLDKSPESDHSTRDSFSIWYRDTRRLLSL